MKWSAKSLFNLSLSADEACLLQAGRFSQIFFSSLFICVYLCDLRIVREWVSKQIYQGIQKLKRGEVV